MGERFVVALAMLVCTVTVGLLQGSDAEACTCAESPTLAKARASAHAAFRCRILSRESPPPRYQSRSATDSVRIFSTGDLVRYVVVADAIWKGAVAETLVLYSKSGGSSCGFPMEVGAEYLLFASRNTLSPPDNVSDPRWFPRGTPWASYLIVDLCGGSRPLRDAAKDLASLGVPIWKKGPAQSSR